MTMVKIVHKYIKEAMDPYCQMASSESNKEAPFNNNNNDNNNNNNWEYDIHSNLRSEA